MLEVVRTMKPKLGKPHPGPGYFWTVSWSIKRKKEAGIYQNRREERLPTHSWLQMTALYIGPETFTPLPPIVVDFLFDEDDGLVWIEVVQELGKSSK